MHEHCTDVHAQPDERHVNPSHSAGLRWPMLRLCRQLETDRMQQVLAHPQYMANPLAAIKNHLETTLPAAVLPKPQQQNKLSRGQARRSKQAGTVSMQS